MVNPKLLKLAQLANLRLKKKRKYEGRREAEEMSDFLCIGDFICLYCEETEGYIYSWQTSSTHNGAYIFHRQDRDRPGGIQNPHTVTFQVCIQNRYKLTKKYRKLTEASLGDPDNLEVKAALAQAKAAANAENEDNISEQKRQSGKRVRYGEVIQLKHVFTEKFIHVSTTQTSRRDKNNMMVYLHPYNAKHAQFRILPRYKVKSEGEVVQIYDQIVLESVKSPGQFFHSSVPWTIDYFHTGSELNLGVEQTGFTLVKCYKPSEEQEQLVRGGSVLRLFHKELEAYIVAEGLFEEQLTEEVHLRIRDVDQLIPKTLYPSTSGITYWQIENESSILNGDVIRWEQQVRFRHMTTRLYLCMNADMQITLTTDPRDPNTVFRLHPIIKEGDEIQFETYARIEHVLSGFWLHALRDDVYNRTQLQGVEDDNTMKGLRWDGASLRKISASGERLYHDAYTIQRVEKEDLPSFNFVAGMVPYLINLIQDFEARLRRARAQRENLEMMAPPVSPIVPFAPASPGPGNYASRAIEALQIRRENKLLNAKKTHRVEAALLELKNFMYEYGVPTKRKQKLMRNLRIIDLLVKLLQFPLDGATDESNLTQIFKAAYDVLHTYMIGNSRKNALYFAKYIDFFQTQFAVKGDIGLNVAQMIVELIRDNRKIVDRITRQQIDEFINLLRNNKNYRYLDLLNVLCVCDGVAIPDNQTYITEQWLMKDQSGVFLTERGQNIKRNTNVVFISTDIGKTWAPLHHFVDKEHQIYNEEQCLFLEHQLDLFRQLCYGRNEFAIHIISRESNYLTWEEGFLCLRLDLLPDALRAKYCDLIIGLFVDVGNNYSVLDFTNISFIYDDIDESDPLNMNGNNPNELVVKDLVTIFPVLRDWITEFLDQNDGMVATQQGHNMLIEQVLRLLHYLVKFGYYGNIRDIQELQKPLINLLNGKNDMPFVQEDEKGGFTKDAMRMIEQYRSKDRYEQSPDTTALVNAKYQALQVLDLLLTYQFTTRLRSFVGMFKGAERERNMAGKKSQLQILISEQFDALDQGKKGLKEQKRMVRMLNDMFESTAYFDPQELTAVLLDLTNYKYDKMVTKALAVLNKYFSSKMDMFKCAVQAQVLITQDSCRVHREVLKFMPILRRLTKAKLNDDQVRTVSDVLEALSSFCHVPYDPEERHPMNQSILINHEILSLVFDYLSQEIDAKLVEQYRGIKTIVIKSIRLLKALARGNDVVQKRIYDRMDTLLKVRVVESEIALALKEAFIGNQATCLKVQSRQLEKIVAMVGDHQERVPELLDLLAAIVKVEGLDIPLKRNQAYVMKFIMQTYSKTAYVFDYSREMREKILTGQESENHLKYLTCLVDLLAICAEGENRFIESLCQTILPMEEILWVLNHESIDYNIKKPYLQYLHWVYMRSSGSFIDTGAGELTHDISLWSFVQNIVTELRNLNEFLAGNKDIVQDLLKLRPLKGQLVDKTDPEMVAHANLHFILDAALPFLRTFFSKFYSIDKDLYPTEQEHVNSMTSMLLTFCDLLKEHLSSAAHLKIIMAAMTTLLPASTLEPDVVEAFMNDFGSIDWFTEKESEVLNTHSLYYSAELDLNERFRTFAVNCSLLYGGHNTVAAQLKYTYRTKRKKQASQKEYTQIGTDEALPLGEEFQEHIRCFVKLNEKKIMRQFALVGKIIQQLGISSSHAQLDEATRVEQENLDIKCLQLLRAIIHNEVVKLPDDWEENPLKHKRQLTRIKAIQIALVEMGAIEKVLPLLARSNDDIAKETLAFLSILLFNANKDVQKSMIEYFKATREEVFFLAIRNRMALSTIAIKERRALAAQREARAKEVLAQTKSMQSTMTVGRKALQDIQNYESNMKRNKMRMSRRASLGDLQFKASRFTEKMREHQVEREKEERRSSQKKKKRGSKDKKMVTFKEPSLAPDLSSHTLVNHADAESMKDFALDTMPDGELELEIKVIPDEIDDGEENLGFSLVGEGIPDDAVEYKDEGYIELVLKVLAGMCDGQFTGLQDYLRDQPDNIKSFNIVAETTAFLNMIYSNINSKTIDLVNVLFSTLNEFISGNQANRYIILNCKVVDYINFILRAGEYTDCPFEKVLELRKVIGHLLYSLIEENGPEPLMVAKEVKDTIDKEALYKVMQKCFDMHMIEKPKWSDYLKRDNLKNIKGAIQSAKSLAKESKQYMKERMEANKPGMRETLIEVGFVYYFTLARFYDIDPLMQEKEDLAISFEQERAFRYYRKNSMSVEFLKEDHLQKVHFRVKNKNVLREEVKEKLKWSVDRSSPSNKIRDLMMWSKDILKDIYYQRRILSNWICAFLTKHWLLWNYLVILLSMAINVLMLATWDAPMSMSNVDLLQKLNEVKDHPNGTYMLPDDMFNPEPDVKEKDLYYTLMYILGTGHNVFSVLTLVSYFLSNHPQFPNIVERIKKARSLKKLEDDDDEDEEVVHVSKLDVQFISLKTFYYLAFVGMSIAGSAFHGYCFAFHLINIVNNNQLLSGVIQAVTQNGKSLLWVAVLGLVIFYLYALAAFALFRDVFDPRSQMFCGSLWQCTVTIIRYGLVGDYDEFKRYTMFRRHESQNSFEDFTYFSLFQVSFFIFITTIGLNIIFGIIVDTFSELRDLKWTAESDMRDTCFICSRKSYDFEHHGLGFTHHVKQEHNMWAYIFFFIHLDDTKPNDYTALDLYVASLLRLDRYDFFPLNRALSLSNLDEDSTESKIDELLQYVLSLVQKQKEEESEKKRQEERLQQKRWHEQHRHALRLQEQEAATDPEAALRRFMQIRDTGRPDWVTVEFETTHL